MAMTRSAEGRIQFELPDEPTIYNLQVLVMPNGEVICGGTSVGWATGRQNIGRFLREVGPTQTKGV